VNTEKKNKLTSRRGFLKGILSAGVFFNGAFILSSCFASTTPPDLVKEALKVVIEGEEKEIECQSKEGLYLLPIELPFKEGENKWEIVINYNPEEKKVEVKKIHHSIEELLSTRNDDERPKCNVCSGTGDCQYCYPVGSGHQWFEDSPACDWCSGSGKCYYCNGKGTFW